MNFKVLGNIKHDGTDYVEGDILNIDKVRGMALVEDGILGVIEGAKEASFRPDADDEDITEANPEDNSEKEKKQVKPKKEKKESKEKKG